MNQNTRETFAIDSKTLNAVSSLSIEVRRVVEGLQGGNHASLHRGASVEFAEHKKYSPGDDLKNIDWRVLARTDRYFVKTHEREVTLSCIMLIDCSPSMAYLGSRAKYSKLDFAKVLLGAMAHVLVKQGDAVGLIAFSEKPQFFLPPDSRPSHLSVFMKKLASVAPAKKGDTGFIESLRLAADRIGQRGMIIVASDMWGAGINTEIAIGGLASRGHDVGLFHVLSPDELDLPFEKTSSFVGMEGEGEFLIDPTMVREDYRLAVKEYCNKWRRVCGKNGVEILRADTDMAPSAVLAEFAHKRHGKRIL